MTGFHRNSVILAAAMAALSTPAGADPRLSEHFYVKNQIVTLRAKPGIETAVAFSPDERIENIAVGNSANWEVNPNKRANVIFVKPSSTRARTNMTVITNERTYLFDLVSSPASPVYMMQFTYPDVPKPAITPPSGSTALAEAAPPPRPEPRPADFNFAWQAKGERRLLPVSCFDDGSSTYLHWSSEMALPAILVRGPNGLEGPVNYTVKGDTIVVDGVPAQLVLRSGKEIATLTPMPRHVAPTQTASAETVRATPASQGAER